MAKLNFNTINRPVLELTMADENKTEITVTTPPEELVEELEATLPELKNILSSADEAATDCSYTLAAKLISCNKQGLQVTAFELKNHYWPKNKTENLLYLVTFLSAYQDFINEINNAKN